jgi:hypothetical protein
MCAAETGLFYVELCIIGQTASSVAIQLSSALPYGGTSRAEGSHRSLYRSTAVNGFRCRLYAVYILLEIRCTGVVVLYSKHLHNSSPK